ncbi:hypothetical protein [Halohasta litorea]|uniref:Bacteriocin biosynthesis cyclodehydratase domain-containing protein n=1 Tax=Halohasta litorea TaxID=869891 RepID=A0ABD6D3Q3_9EURY|nr:hypothetical protein [Halohasta litorea]
MASYPAAYSPTGYGIHDGEAVVRTPWTVKTLQGENIEVVTALLAAMDGETAASDLVDRVPGATVEYVDLLYDHGLAYDAAGIPDGLKDAGYRGLIEPVLAALPPERHHEVPERLGSQSVAVFGHSAALSPALSRLRAADVTVDDRPTGEPDVVLLSERLERDSSWTAANEQWAASESTLLRTRLTARGWRLGPVFTPNAPACLDCLYSRVDANRAGGRLFTETIGGDPPYARAYIDTVTELLFRTLLGQVPRYLDDQFVVYDHYDRTVRTPRVFAVPHCEVCDV